MRYQHACHTGARARRHLRDDVARQFAGKMTSTASSSQLIEFFAENAMADAPLVVDGH